MTTVQMMVGLEITALELQAKGCSKAAAIVEEAKEVFLEEIKGKKEAPAWMNTMVKVFASFAPPGLR